MITRHSRRLLLCLSLLAPGLSLAAAPAAEFPARPVTLLAPIAPGGMTDALARLLSHHLTTAWGQPVVVENRPGAGGVVGTSVVARAKPDGLTALVTITSHIQNPALRNDMPFDAIQDFVGVSRIAQSQVALVVTPDMPSTLEGFVEHVKANPKTYNFSSFGNATTGHIYGQKFATDNGLDMVHVPYQGAGPQLTAMLGDHVKVGWIDVGTVRPHLESGKLKMLGVIGTQRAPLFPQVPTLGEAGYPGFEAAGWLGVLLPAGTPPEVVNEFSEQVQRIVALPESQARLKELALVPVGDSSADFNATLRQDAQTWKDIIQRLGITAN